MSTASEISRILEARNTIRDKLINLGLAGSTDKIDDLADVIDAIENQGAIQATVSEGSTYTIPSGYHNGAGVVVGTGGSGSYDLQTKTTTPTKQQQQITSDSGYYGLSAVIVEPIPDAYQNVSGVTAQASDVLSGKIIVNSNGDNIVGTIPTIGAVDQALSTTNTQYNVPAGYHNGSGKVKIILEEKTVTPSPSSQTVIPTAGKVLDQVIVESIPSNYADVTSDDGTATDVLYGVKVHSVSDGQAVQLTGSMVNNGTISGSIDGLTIMSYSIPSGYASGGSVALSSDIENALAAI